MGMYYWYNINILQTRNYEEKTVSVNNGNMRLTVSGEMMRYLQCDTLIN